MTNTEREPEVATYDHLANLIELHDALNDLHSRIHANMEMIKDETGPALDDRWNDLYAVIRLIGIGCDLASSARDRARQS